MTTQFAETLQETIARIAEKAKTHVDTLSDGPSPSMVNQGLVDAGVPRRHRSGPSMPLPDGIPGLLILGDCGTGKSRRAGQHLRYEVEMGGSPKWFYVPEILARVRSTYNGSGETEYDVVQMMVKPRLIVLDDALVRLTDHEYEVILVVLAKRYDEERVTIVTTNAGPDEFMKNTRLASRLSAYTWIRMDGKDWRSK